MKKKILSLLCCVFPSIILAFGDSLSTDYPFLYNIHSKCSVNYEPLTAIYYYSYSISNDISNKGNIWIIKVDISRDGISQVLDTVGLKFSRSWIERQFRMDMEVYGNKVVPVSASKLPDNRWDGWDAGVGNGQAIYISVLSPRPKRGESVSGIELTSRGLPGIRRMTVLPWFEAQLFFPAIDDTSETALEPFSFEKEDSIREMVNFYGWTVGPYAPPAIFNPNTILDTLLSYTRQSVQLGWLRDGKDNDCDPDEKPDDGVVKNLENRLLKARNELTEGDTIKASRELEKFIKKVERISKRSDVMTGQPDEAVLAGEAYALLKYNAEYLLEHLITLPPKPKGTLLQQIDSLKIEVQNQSKKKNIGGVIFVKGLTLLIDKARKELVKKDSSETAIYIALFQLVVDETWKLTQKLEEKKKKFAALYVLDEAYIALHHRAEYILEALPEPRRSVHEQRQQILEKDLQQELEKMKKEVEEK